MKKRISFYDQISKNKRNSILLSIFVFLVLFSLVYIISYVFAPESAILILSFSTILICAHIYTSYNYGDKIVLAATGAKPAHPRKHIYYLNIVEGLSLAAGIPKPKAYVIENDEINAFATGKDPKHASIAVTTGALEKLNRLELEGVVAHEISHIKNYDIRFAMLVAVMVGLVAIISHIFLRSWRFSSRRRKDEGAGLLILIGLLLAIFAPIIVRLVQLAISRKREYLADASAAKLTRYPEGLASALEKIMKYNRGKMKVSEAVSHLFFVDPNKSALDELFATHPPIKKRIEILRSM